ncbi:hypothetical protein DZ11C13_44310 [Escherichia coli]
MSEKLKIVYRPLQELSPYAHNARTHSTEQVAQLVESIKQFGWTNPVLIDEKGEIIAGHGRVMAAEMLKMDSVPVIVLSGLTDEQKKAYRLADNRLPMNAGWDEDLLRMELSDLINADFDVSLTGFRGDFVKAVSKAFPKKVGTWGNTETPNGTVTVTISDDHNFDRQIIIPPIIFNGIAYDDPGSGNNPGGTRYTGYGFEVRKNGVLIASRETKGAIPGSYSAVIDMPSGGGSVTLEFKIFQKGNQGAGNITDCTVIVTKKAASGISIR